MDAVNRIRDSILLLFRKHQSRATILVVDSVTLPIVDSLFTVDELAKERIFDVQLAHAFGVSRLSVIYYLEGTSENVSAIVNDSHHKNVLLFTTKLDRQYMIALTRILPRITALYDNVLSPTVYGTTAISSQPAYEALTNMLNGIVPSIQSTGPDSTVIAQLLMANKITPRAVKCTLLILDRQKIPLSPLYYRITVVALYYESPEPEPEPRNNPIWDSIRSLLLPEAHKVFERYKSKYDAWIHKMDTQDTAAKYRAFIGTDQQPFNVFQRHYNRVISILNQLKLVYNRILPAYELQLETLETPSADISAQVRTLLNRSIDPLEQKRIQILFTAIGKMSRPVSSSIQTVPSKSLESIIQNKNATLIYITECVSLSESIPGCLVLSPNKVSWREWITKI